ncbi:hypothetical protein [Frondihabitans cladoniiphilus]|uniref:DUF6311 domain-containing protein n=1 Tax=Frondihabitans cladoniiphilus TaxID=715785 RepID=A0ABP8W2Q6_9MICO
MTLPETTLEATPADPSAAEQVSPRRRRIAWEVLWSIVAGAISVVVAVAALRISPADLGRRWASDSPDMLLGYTLFKNSTQAFSFATNPNLGFPHGMNAFFSEQVDPSAALGMAALSLVLHNGFLLFNLSFLLTFFTAGVAAYFFFRALRVGPLISGVFAAVFSLAPYHFYRVGFGHIFLANYWAIPLVGILLLVAAGDTTDPFKRWSDAATGTRTRLLRRLVPPTVLGLLIASSGSYFFVFGVIVIGGVWAFSVIRVLLHRDRIRTLLAPTMAIFPLGFFVVVELALLAANYGQRYHVYFTGRQIYESELFAGRLVTLLAPWAGSRIPVLDRILPKYDASSPLVPVNEPPGTPLLAAIGLILLAVALVVYAVAGRTGLGSRWFGRVLDDPRTRMLAPAMMWTFLFFIITGLGMAVALVIGPQIRSWARISIILILIGLAVMAVLVQAATARHGIRAILIGLVVVVAIGDQVVGAHAVFTVAPAKDQEVAAFVSSAEKTLPQGCGVVQLPIKGFPDTGPIGDMQDYDESLPYLYTSSSDLRWSYGSIPGTYAWDDLGNATTPAELASAVKSSGACAVEVDLAAYSANQQGWQPLVEAATGTTAPAITSSGKRWLLFVVPGKG